MSVSKWLWGLMSNYAVSSYNSSQEHASQVAVVRDNTPVFILLLEGIFATPSTSNTSPKDEIALVGDYL